ncbi:MULTISPECIES: hypothetical protein [unclassified Anabaena]|uniref:hypothetical protein n=1 Tax=unclassified Anabaena TaxID=2619674 RepID=UPI001444E1E5|nr:MULTISPECIES: hypothetical protein [unclassified Anabaena]MTJ08925.1 hypothetical protein [Anabaena sp. UHCC 0204]MTJ51279.1 hypothetical protein [Anabaena sp. UHCC 0253]
MRITVADIYPHSSEQMLNDLTLEELTNVVGGYRRRRRRGSRYVEPSINLDIDTELESWRTELNTMMEDLRDDFSN